MRVCRFEYVQASPIRPGCKDAVLVPGQAERIAFARRSA